jgi:hypothetical protein
LDALGMAISVFIWAVTAGRECTEPLVDTARGPVPLDAHRRQLVAYASSFDRRSFEDAFLKEVQAFREGRRPRVGRRLAPPDFSRM